MHNSETQQLLSPRSNSQISMHENSSSEPTTTNVNSNNNNDNSNLYNQEEQHLDYPCSSLFYKWYNWVFGEFLLKTDTKVTRARKLTIFLFGQFALIILISSILMIVEAQQESNKTKQDIMIAAASLLIFFALGVSFPCNIVKNKFYDAPEGFVSYLMWCTSVLCLIGAILLPFFPSTFIQFTFVVLSVQCDLPSKYFLIAFEVACALFLGVSSSFPDAGLQVVDAYQGIAFEKFGFGGLAFATFEIGVAWILIGVQNHNPAQN